ncbi:dienelactone hydrolase family protein [Dyella sp.]|uniref:dienelactone hydrolase family protein n=1 Tax=Dyella sp. TaxID=1869338 RepID=UPI002B49CC5B|nr:dienelactone hydrolase family protein [Dyella sp.]HKT29358.1 dienelactone hydrolase family protein [Dyella sp.]
MQTRFAAAFALLLLAAHSNLHAATRQSFPLNSSTGKLLIECFSTCSDVTRPAVLILSGSKGFGAPAYDDIGQTFRDEGLNAYLVHYLNPKDLDAIEKAGSSHARETYYATRQSAWISDISDAILYFKNRPHQVGNVGVVGISLGAEMAAATSANRKDIGALVIVDGGFPDGYSQPVHALPPLLLIWGSDDHAFPLSIGIDLQQLAHRLGQAAKLDVYKGESHAFFVRTDTSQAHAAHLSTAQFLVSQLLPRKP